MVDVGLWWINCHCGPTSQSDTAEQLAPRADPRGRSVAWTTRGGGNCSPMVLLGVEPVALREFHRRLHGNPRPLHGSPDVSYWNTRLPLVAATCETHMWFATTLLQLESRSLRRWTNAAADVTCQAASTFPVASSPLQDEVFVVLLGHPQFEGIFEQNLFGFEPHCSKRQGPKC